MPNLLAVGLGGMVGAILRYLTGVVSANFISSSFPFATFLVNIIGCTAIGIAWVFVDKWQLPTHIQLFFIVGTLGAFTTFSTFSHDTMQLVHQGKLGMAGVYVLASNFLGLLSVWASFSLAKKFF